MSQQTGRNDPCPCGSGKKYKHCHLAIAERTPASPTERALALHQRDRELSSEILVYGQRHLPPDLLQPALDLLRGSHLDPELLMLLFEPWLAYGFRPEGRTLAARYLERRGHLLGPGERAWLAAQEAAWLSLWEVRAIDPGVGLSMVDLLSGEERFVHEIEGSRSASVREVILSRVVDFKGLSVFCGMHPRGLPPHEGAATVERALITLGQRRAPVAPAALREPGIDCMLVAFWEEATYEFACRPAPVLHNTDGDNLLMVTDHYSFRTSDRPEIASRLAAMNGASAPDGDGTSYSFTRRGNRIHKDWENTVVGHAELGTDSLQLMTNSKKRADALRRRVERALGKLVKRGLREVEDPASAKRPVGVSAPPIEPSPEMLEVMRQFKERHYASWLDESIPALDGLSPREAARRAASRKKLVVLLNEIEYRESRLPEAGRYDVAKLRTALGPD